VHEVNNTHLTVRTSLAVFLCSWHTAVLCPHTSLPTQRAPLLSLTVRQSATCTAGLRWVFAALYSDFHASNSVVFQYTYTILTDNWIRSSIHHILTSTTSWITVNYLTLWGRGGFLFTTMQCNRILDIFILSPVNSSEHVYALSNMTISLISFSSFFVTFCNIYASIFLSSWNRASLSLRVKID